jgi:hypothetical protein
MAVLSKSLHVCIHDNTVCYGALMECQPRNVHWTYRPKRNVHWTFSPLWQFLPVTSELKVDTLYVHHKEKHFDHKLAYCP